MGIEEILKPMPETDNYEFHPSQIEIEKTANFFQKMVNKLNSARVKKRAAKILASYVLLINAFSFSLVAISLDKTYNIGKEEVEKEIRLGRSYLHGGLHLSESAYSYDPKKITAYVTEETYEWIKIHNPEPVPNPYPDIKTNYIIIRKDENGKEYLDLKDNGFEGALRKIFLNLFSKPGRELAYKLIKS